MQGEGDTLVFQPRDSRIVGAEAEVIQKLCRYPIMQHLRG